MNWNDDSNFLRSVGVAADRDTVDAEVEARWLAREAKEAQAKAKARWSTIVRLRHDRKIYRWTILVLVVSNLLAYRAWEWLR